MPTLPVTARPIDAAAILEEKRGRPHPQSRGRHGRSVQSCTVNRRVHKMLGMETGVHLGQVEARLSGVEREVADLRGDVRNLRADMTAEFRAMRADMTAEFRSVRTDMRSDFRTSFGALIVVALGLAGLMARGFHWL